MRKKIIDFLVKTLFGVHVMMTCVKCDCKLSTQEDFSEPQPVFIQNAELLSPTDATGDMHVKTGEIIEMHCPGEGRYGIRYGNDTEQFRSAAINCVSNHTFGSGEWEGPFSSLRCNRLPYFTAEWSSEKCFEGNGLIRVGYKVGNRLHRLYEVCFDNTTSIPLYVTHELSGSSLTFQHGLKRPSFSPGIFFDGVPVSTLYKRKCQLKRFIDLFGEELTNKYITKNEFLNRGHLAARADFIFTSWQRASFIYINVAPQWATINSGNWGSLESSLRTRISGKKRRVQVYSGTYGVATLNSVDGQPQEIYLHLDDNNNPTLPVPMFYYKVVYDAVNKEGVAFVTVNNPYYSAEELQQLEFCEDICRGSREYRWINWKPDNIRLGYSFCCTIEDFIRTVGHLPDMDVQGIFN